MLQLNNNLVFAAHETFSFMMSLLGVSFGDSIVLLYIRKSLV